MEVVLTTGAISRAKLQSCHHHHHHQTNIQFFLQAGYLSCRPTYSVKALKGKISHSMDLLTPSSFGGLPTLSLTTNSSWLSWGRVAMPLISPLMPVPQNVCMNWKDITPGIHLHLADCWIWGLMQERVYKTAVRDTSDLKQHLTDIWTSVITKSSMKMLLNGESGYMHVRKWKDVTLNIC